MKKNILFIINNLMIGGAEKALISLLTDFDYTKYNVDLLLLKKEGEFVKEIPDEVNLLPAPKEFYYFNTSLKKALLKSFLKFRYDVFINRLIWAFKVRQEKINSRKEQRMWRYIAPCLKSQEKEYDVAIGYLQKTPNYYCVDKVMAKRKIGYVHNDYLALNLDPDFDLPYFQKTDHIYTVSQSSKNTLNKVFPSITEKFDVMLNIISHKTTKEKANELINFSKKGITLLSIGTLSHQKGYDIAIEACKLVIDKGYDIYWYVIGEGEKRGELEKIIDKNNLQDRFILLGKKDNPYPYIKQTDIFVHTAKFEGYGIVVTEAKILNKPIVLTNFTTAQTLIKDNFNGMICEMNAVSVADKLTTLILDEGLREKFSKNLAKEKHGTEKEIEKFYKVINNI